MPPENPPAPAPSSWETFYHPASGALILGADLLAFGGELATGFLDTIGVSLATFAVVFAGVWSIQRRWGQPTESRRATFGKAFLGAFLAGIPFPIAGTVFGTAILFLSGLHRLRGLRNVVGIK